MTDVLCVLLCSCLVMPDSFTTPWTVAHQAPLSTWFPRQEYWSGLPFPSPGALPDSRTEPASPALAGGLFTSEPPGKPRVVLVAQSCLTLGDPMDCSPPAPPSMGFYRQEHWSVLPFPSPGESSWPRDLTRVSGIAGKFFPTEPPVLWYKKVESSSQIN